MKLLEIGINITLFVQANLETRACIDALIFFGAYKASFVTNFFLILCHVEDINSNFPPHKIHLRLQLFQE